jgi:uncharacterized protein YkwD
MGQAAEGAELASGHRHVRRVTWLRVLPPALVAATILAALPAPVMSAGRDEARSRCMTRIAAPGTAYRAAAPPPAAASLRLDTASRSAADVRLRWSQLKPTYGGSPFAVAPTLVPPHACGSLAPGFLQDGLNAVNYARYLAGLPADVTLDASYVDRAQHGSVLLAVGQFAHSQPKPADMAQDFYDVANAATSSSNIGWGYGSLADFNFGCMDDSDSSNIDRVGHRRWLLDPPLQKTGMGYADARTDTFVFDWSRASAVGYDAIKWPCAGPFPVQMFSAGTAWSITLNPDRYDWTSGGHTVTMRRVRDGHTWTLTAADTDKSGDYFNFDTGGYGVANCFIFRPDPVSVGAYRVGDSFQITLSGGIFQSDGVTPAEVSYTTTFMSHLPLTVATVTTPVARSTLSRGRKYSVHGYLKPRHAAGSLAVSLRCYKRESGYWKLRKTVRAKVGDYSTYSRYSVSLALASSGRWRLRASHGCDEHRASISAYRYVTVR